MNPDMNEDKMLKLISDHEVFADLDSNELAQLCSVVSFREVDAKDVIFEICDAPEHFFYLLDGALCLQFPDNTQLHIGPNDLIGEIGVLNGDFRLGRLVAEQDSKLIEIRTDYLFDADVVSPSLSLKILRRLSRRVTNFFRSTQQVSSREVIASGESEYVEFKSTLRWNLKAERKDPNITHAVLKTIGAFLNSAGGTLIVGVADDGTILGLDDDRFQNEDKLLLFLTDVIKTKLGVIHLDNIHYQIEQIDQHDILRVDVRPSDVPCYVIDDKLDRFYVRTGPSTTDVRLSNLHSLINKRFG